MGNTVIKDLSFFKDKMNTPSVIDGNEDLCSKECPHSVQKQYNNYAPYLYCNLFDIKLGDYDSTITRRCDNCKNSFVLGSLTQEYVNNKMNQNSDNTAFIALHKSIMEYIKFINIYINNSLDRTLVYDLKNRINNLYIVLEKPTTKYNNIRSHNFINKSPMLGWKIMYNNYERNVVFLHLQSNWQLIINYDNNYIAYSHTIIQPE